MAKQKVKSTEEVTEIENPNLSLDNTAYALVKKGADYQFVKFNFDVDTKTMSDIEVVYTGGKYDTFDELALHVEDDVYST